MTDLPDGATWYPAPTIPDPANANATADARPALALVLPGGGYHGHAAHEGEGYARWLNAIGIPAVVFEYPVVPHRYPDAVVATRALVRSLRAGAHPGLPSDPRILLVGSSAGGHLAALVSSAPTPGERAVSDVDDRPDLALLCYPVISMTDHQHRGSADNLLGKGATVWAQGALDTELMVDAATPPTFLWHTAEDPAVHVTHSLLYGQALARRAVPFELHVFERGAHGIGLAEGTGTAAAWPGVAEAWLRDRGW
ncbi:alpha/beta hydrolase [Curtobacterium pusillum]|uniref:alpha/beta hydrolase n=1 Tax=Curtobacterium pusillum TaxID=69373 RepID=UPI001642D7F2|nr:alpha/beta hydrolase [Curtobacterium pusillum]